MSRLLLDTHVFVWAKTGERQLAEEVRKMIVAPENEIFVSLASAWELAIKASIGKLDGDPALLIGGRDVFERVLSESGFQLLGTEAEHVFAAAGLPLHHRDPFDRIIIAQATTEHMTLVTADARFTAYKGLALLYAI